MDDKRELVGLFPAGGLAKRLGIRSSKEVLPVLNETNTLQPVGKFLLDSYKQGGIKKVHIITRREKTDIQSTFGDGSSLGLKINYLDLQCYLGTPYTLDEAWPFIKDVNVALGFPDIILQPRNTFALLSRHLNNGAADIVLGLFPTQQTSKSDMVEFDSHGVVQNLHIKPAETTLRYTWITAVWRPTFTHYMHRYLAENRQAYETDKDIGEPFVGTIINAALQDDFLVEGIVIPDGRMLDIGTPDDLHLATTTGFLNPQQ